MTNNPTIDGVSREYVLRLTPEAHNVMLGMVEHCLNIRACMGMDEGFKDFDTEEEHDFVKELRALLDADHTVDSNAKAAPAVERKEPAPVSRFWCHEAQNIRCVREADYDALQSTIAQLQARIAELESGMGEPVAWSFKEYVWATGLGAHVWRDKLETERPDTEEGEVKDLVPLYTTPPAPVATLWEICVRDEPGNPESPCEYVYVSSEAERDSLLRQGGASVYAGYACLDATAALNEVKS